MKSPTPPSSERAAETFSLTFTYKMQISRLINGVGMGIGSFELLCTILNSSASVAGISEKYNGLLGGDEGASGAPLCSALPPSRRLPALHRSCCFRCDAVWAALAAPGERSFLKFDDVNKFFFPQNSNRRSALTEPLVFLIRLDGRAVRGGTGSKGDSRRSALALFAEAANEFCI